MLSFLKDNYCNCYCCSQWRNKGGSRGRPWLLFNFFIKKNWTDHRRTFGPDVVVNYTAEEEHTRGVLIKFELEEPCIMQKLHYFIPDVFKLF